jgi:hypothetical protein
MNDEVKGMIEGKEGGFKSFRHTRRVKVTKKCTWLELSHLISSCLWSTS